MKPIRNTELANFIDQLPPAKELFQPTAMYDPDGDCIEFLFANEMYYGERIDDLITVYYSQETKELIGSVIKNLSAFTRKYPKVIAISVEDGTIRLEHLFVAAAATMDLSKSSLLIYKKLAKAAEESKAEAKLLCEA